MLHPPCSETDVGTLALHLSPPHNSTVNVTLNKLHFTGPSAPGCAFGGTALIEQNKTEVLSICEPFNGRQGLAQNILSSVENLYLIIYWYKSLGVIAAHLLVQTTKCQAVHLDPCAVSYFCYNHDKSSVLCDRYLSKVSSDIASFKQTSARTSLLELVSMSRQRKVLSVTHTMHASTCMTIQLRSSGLRWLDMKTDCFFTLKSTICFVQNVDVEYHIRVHIPDTNHETGYVFNYNDVSQSNMDALMSRGTNTQSVTRTRTTKFKTLLKLQLGAPPHYSTAWTEIKIEITGKSHTGTVLPVDTVIVPFVPEQDAKPGGGIFDKLPRALFFVSTNFTGDMRPFGKYTIAIISPVDVSKPDLFIKVPIRLLCFASAFNEVHDVSLADTFAHIDLYPSSHSTYMYLRPVVSNNLSGSLKCPSEFASYFVCQMSPGADVYFKVKAPRLYIKWISKRKHTWQVASETCQKLGGHLPLLYDATESEEILQILKGTSNIHMVIIYIGLTHAHKVGSQDNTAQS